MDNTKADAAFTDYYRDRTDVVYDEAFRVLLTVRDYVEDTIFDKGYVEIPWLGTLRLVDRAEEGKSVTFEPCEYMQKLQRALLP